MKLFKFIEIYKFKVKGQPLKCAAMLLVDNIIAMYFFIILSNQCVWSACVRTFMCENEVRDYFFKKGTSKV